MLSANRIKFHFHQVYVGGHNISRDHTEIKKIKKIISHENFDIVSFDNDIALLELESPITYGPRVSSVCLPSGEQTDFTNELTLISGWGRLGEKMATSSALRSVVVPIWSEKDCHDSGYGSLRLTGNMMCGGYPEGKKDACQGQNCYLN
jgi:guanylate cyclase